MDRALVDEYDVLLLDLDGVVYAGASALPGVADQLAAAKARGVARMFVTNNAARTPDTVAKHLTELGVGAEVADVVTSAQAAAELVAQLVPAGAPVLVVGGEGLIRAVDECGLKPVSSADEAPRAVVQGFHPEVNWIALAEGAYAVANGTPWIASNADPTIPTGRGIAPGNGALIEVIRIATGQTPRSVGKPEPTLFHTAVRRSGRNRPLVVGDRLDTDIAGASASGYPSLLVFTGVTTLADAFHATADQRPTYLGWDLGALLVEHAEPALTNAPAPTGSTGASSVSCGGWSATVAADGAVRLDRATRDTPAAPQDALRALAMAVWTAHDAGVPVDVDAAVELADATGRDAEVDAGEWSAGGGTGSSTASTSGREVGE